MKTVVLAEKPSVGQELARVLRCTEKRKGYFEGDRYVVTWALGHLVTLAEPEDYEARLKEWRLEDLPMLPEKMKLQIIKKTSHQFHTVSSILKRGDIGDLIIATDAGREGELVARWIMKLSSWKKPFRRLWVSSQTDQAITQGFADLKPGHAYDNLFQAAVCRSEADWLIGLNVTRALTCKFNTQLSAGRVQTPTLAMIVDREEEIKHFKPQDFWTVSADFGDYTGYWRGKDGNIRFFDQAKAQEIADKVKGGTGQIIEVKVEDKSEYPPLAYDLTELQRDANRRYAFSAQKTLSVLQGLYERHKLVTYPRTDSRYITGDMVATLPQRLTAMAQAPYKALAQPLLQKKLTPGKHLVDDSRVYDHHAIIPTEQPLDLSRLDAEEKKIYDLIARRFIAVLYPPYRYDRITLVTAVNGERLYARGRVVKEMGWRAVTEKPEGGKKGDEDLVPEQNLLHQEQGTSKEVKTCKLNKGKTQPPPHYTEATLLTAMESPGQFIEDEDLRESIKQGGLGTPATRAEIIEKLLYNYYIERHGKDLVPTSRGIQLVGLAPTELRSPELTARWELRLSNIARGQEREAAFMTDIRRNAVELVQGIKEDTSQFKLDNLTKTKCPACGKYMQLYRGKRGNVLVCQDRTCGYRQEEEKGGSAEYWASSKGGRRSDRGMIDRFSDNKKKDGGSSIGDLFQAALTKKEGKP